MFIDIHAHLDLIKENQNAIKNAKQKGILVVNNSIDYGSIKETLKLSSENKNIRAALGVYPIEALKLSEKELEEIIEFIKKNKEKALAIGEVGIDLKWSQELEQQKKIFQKFIDLAKELDKPLIVHSRNAERECIEILEKNNCKKVVFHCFSGRISLAKRIIKNNWFLSIPTNVCHNSQMQEIVKIAEIKHIFCETDSPYLHPIKGQKDNEPANVIEGYKKIAEIKGISLQEVEKTIEDNFNKLFSL
ncbi:MAG: TatD family hydrolase [Candidatus Nanoarchaeia archaeon]